MKLIRGIWIVCVPVILMAQQHIFQEYNSPAVRAFLDVIACLEGTYDFGYNMRFGGGTFQDYNRHPRDNVCVNVKGKNICSTAAGRYQLTYDQWNVLGKKVQAKTFAPKNQDYAMIYVLWKSKALEHIKQHHFREALESLRGSKESVDKLLTGAIRRHTVESLYATFIARYRHYATHHKRLPADILHQYKEKPEVKAFLDTIAFAEGTDSSDGYRICFTGKRCATLKEHPKEVICSQVNGSKLCSTAAGRYQFLKDTWRRIAWRIAASDFSPENQDRGAIQMMLDMQIIDPLLEGNIETAIKRASKKWASLPGTDYNQPSRHMSVVKNVFSQRLSMYKNFQK